ncbi:AAA family ATPase [Buchananella felis]|uniref:AAA family ATPase n=1 Tax=Buchananella felis TaxID=3231492 RepID=UPI0035297049
MLELGATSQGLQIVSFDAAVDGNPVISATSSWISSATEAEVNPDCRHGHRLLRVREIRGRKAPPRTYVTFNGFSPEALIVRIKKDKLLAALRRKFGKRAIREESEHLFELYGVLQPWWRDHRNNLPHEVVELYGELFQRGRSLQSFRKSAEEGGLDKLLESYVEESDDWRHLQVRGYPSLRSRQYFPDSAYFGLGEEFKMALKDLVIAKEGLRAIRESVRYLGPLREDPQVVSRSGELNRSLPAGVKGEYAADLLSREKDRVIEFRDWDQRHLKSKLSEAVSLWTSYLQVGDRVAVEDHGKLGRGLRIRVHGVDRDLTTVGVGASQLLPVVMMVLAATPGSTICIEQPELHLHPAVQSRLADFFLYARPDVALVIETHSEYMITRIRRRVAEGFASIDRVAIMFAEQRNGVTSFRLLKISEDGDLSDWPDGFFDAQDEDARALVRAIAQRVAFS